MQEPKRKSLFVDGQRFEVSVAGETVKAYGIAVDTWFKATLDVVTGRVSPVTPGFPEELRERIETRFAP